MGFRMGGKYIFVEGGVRRGKIDQEGLEEFKKGFILYLQKNFLMKKNEWYYKIVKN